MKDRQTEKERDRGREETDRLRKEIQGETEREEGGREDEMGGRGVAGWEREMEARREQRAWT